MNRDTVKCFWCEPSDRGEESLRRFCFSDDKTHYHNAEVVLGEIALPFEAQQYASDDFDHADPRWPTHCQCGYAFQPQDEWQHNITRKLRVVDTGALYQFMKLPPGAMYDANWGEGRMRLCVVGPARCGHWDTSTWERTGDPRKPETVSCTPSIYWNQGKGDDREWHGYLTNGVLVPC